MKKLLILGAGGHGKVVAEVAEAVAQWGEIAFLDDRADTNHGTSAVVGKLEDVHLFVDEYKHGFVAIGNNEQRLELIEQLTYLGYDIPVIIHPRSYVSKYSTIGKGTVILPGAVVNTNTVLGKGCIVNINACIDHDCKIGDGVHISSGAVVRSMVNIGRVSLIGARSCIRAGTSLAEKFILSDGDVV